MKRWIVLVVVGGSLAFAGVVGAMWGQSYGEGFHTPLNGVHYPMFGMSWSFYSGRGVLIARWDEILARGQKKWTSTDYQNLPRGFGAVAFRRAPAGTVAGPNRVWAEHGAVGVRYWVLVLLGLVMPVMWSVRRVRRRLVAGRVGRCAKCGYDLRATPERCPECGTETGSGVDLSVRGA